MVWYVAIIAVVNLGLGYALALYLGAGRAQFASATVDSLEDSAYSDADIDA